VIVYCSLDHPNEKLIALLLAADAWRRQGVERLVLTAPYLCYMRQDLVFRPGEPLSRDVVCGLLGSAFDRVVCVDAHLHRTRSLSQAFGGIEAEDLSAAGPLAGALFGPERPLVVGPDAESEPWVRRIADRLGGESLTFRKTRSGDDKILLEAPDLAAVRGRPVMLVDDICSSGATLIACAAQLRAAGVASIDVGVVHALFNAETGARLGAAGVQRIVSTDSVPHSTNQAPLAALLAQALRDEVKS
jgi:ribose-phosphate pyrophosphokinase